MKFGNDAVWTPLSERASLIAGLLSWLTYCFLDWAIIAFVTFPTMGALLKRLEDQLGLAIFYTDVYCYFAVGLLGGRPMSIIPILRGQPFEPETIEAMASACKRLYAELNLDDRDDAITQVVAHYIIQAAERGIRSEADLYVSAMDAIKTDAMRLERDALLPGVAG